jgi:hypothetical protein
MPIVVSVVSSMGIDFISTTQVILDKPSASLGPYNCISDGKVVIHSNDIFTPNGHTNW